MKSKIFFILPTLFAGGAERIISFVSQNLDKEKFDVTLIVIGRENESKFEVTGIPVIFLNKSRVLNGVFEVSILIAKQKPQVVVSCIAHLNIMMGLISVFVSDPIYVGRQAGVPGTPVNYNKPRKKKKSLIKLFFNYEKFGLKQLDHYICQSADMKQNLMNTSGIKDEFITIINNPVTQTNIIKNTTTNTNKIKKYITVGRLSEAKGYVRILKVLSRLSFPFQYTIIGEGTYYDTIIKEVTKLGLKDNVIFIDYTANVSKYLVDNDMFLQGSFSEGFPNALLESCAVGTPVIAFNAPGGTKEIVEDQVNGFLVEDEDEFLKRLNDERQWDPKEIRESVYRKFNKNKIINDYENFFIKLLN
ncbi:glycosyltransferase [Winogradskyella thalassocola]|uniref:Glycosyltransferase involved in cell wall bisynthesis n=1 Tax=Winogradskyella thalassocola TaxID=262004 RepID=A0A1G8DKH3_9FLAO|nr:glycosyltransferase [Winogradskyella thalassocola]SDH57880.1 Glycosyltransferase involved in cell wall bisynthesis [Winogradskyella thalassocola]